MTWMPEYRIAKLQLQAGDVVAIKVNERLTEESAHQIRKTFPPLLPPGVKAMILDRSMDVSVLTAKEIETRAFPAEVSDEK